ncbi:type II and III secretion system protein family protein [Paraburkholderia sp. J63]|uniref:type II and III secretion system protein family protein n=1 Tax=Paraburkholderia sp. J63 TaxID=2805434 RepID=UPI002ABD72BE|nr:type II and III secretion system protein family protein [Paraburkholderia sp. J63]
MNPFLARSRHPSLFRTLASITPALLIAAFATAAVAGSASHTPSSVALAQPASTVAASTDTPGTALDIGTGKGVLLRLPAPATAVFVADPDIADVHVPNPQAVFVLGKKAGTTTLYALGANNKTVLQRTVVVNTDVAYLHQMLATRFPSFTLHVEGAPGSLLVSGQVPSAADADAVVQTLTPYLHDKESLINRLSVTQSLQVNLHVRIAEVDRTVTQQFGVNWSAVGGMWGNFIGGMLSGRTIQDTTGVYQLPSSNAFSTLLGFKAGKTNIQALIDALDQEGLITMLAEPNLTAMSGETASFLAGGEFPIPVAQSGSTGGSIGVQFKPFGVSLNFTPMVLSDNRISLKVNPEVSQLDSSASVTTNGVTIPGLSVRRLSTTVELGSGQSFAIGGLLTSDSTDTLSALPGIGTLPVLGKLFSSRAYQDKKTELVVIVTPYLVNPTDGNRLRTPLDTLISPSSDIEYGMQRSLGLDPLSGDTPRLVGAAGFVY